MICGSNRAGDAADPNSPRSAALGDAIRYYAKPSVVMAGPQYDKCTKGAHAQ